MSVPRRYFLGLPAWAFPGWSDRYFVDRPSRLASYASVFNSVEGNTTFYRIPDDRTVAAWLGAVQGRDFRFCFKLPRSVTHQRDPDLAELDRFLSAIRPLKYNLGPLLVQLPASAGPDELPRLDTVLAAVADQYRFVLEVRHPAYFREPVRLDDLLSRYGCGRVMLDSRPIYDGDRSHPEVLEALHEKPDVPVLDTVYNDLAFGRLILHPDLESDSPYLDLWAARVAAYIDAGIETYMMIHCPNNLHCPPLAAAFHARLAKHIEKLPPLPAWPVPQQSTLL